MGLNPEKEKIFEAWRNLERCPPSERAKSEIALNGLLDEIIAKGHGEFTRDQILDYLFSEYKDYCKEKRKAESLQVVQSALKKA